MKRIIKQALKPDHILVTFEDGTTEKRPYLVDSEGNKYADLDPNNEIFALFKPEAEA